jgi:hypothetical protein
LEVGEVTVASLPGTDWYISLREAMCAANNNAGSDKIAFDILGCGVACTIQPTIALPILTGDGTIIDGYTQVGAARANLDIAQGQIEVAQANLSRLQNGTLALQLTSAQADAARAAADLKVA